MRVFLNFLRKFLQSLSRCGCGKPVEKHKEDAVENFLRDIQRLLPDQPEKWQWNREDCTTNDKLTNAFGEVRFLGRGEQKISKVTTGLTRLGCCHLLS